MNKLKLSDYLKIQLTGYLLYPEFPNQIKKFGRIGTRLNSKTKHNLSNQDKIMEAHYAILRQIKLSILFKTHSFKSNSTKPSSQYQTKLSILTKTEAFESKFHKPSSSELTSATAVIAKWGERVLNALFNGV